MKALLDTNIVIHREASRVVNRDIGNLFKWLDKGKYSKCIHPVTVEEINRNANKVTVETLSVKMDSYESLKSVAPIDDKVKAVCSAIDQTPNDKNDTLLLNEVYCDRVDILITEDKKIHFKAALIGINDKVFTIDSFLEKVISEHPELINYKVLSVTKKHLGEINLKDSFFDSFREDYGGFDKWFNRKADEIAYVTSSKDKVLSFLYLKVEGKDENYSDIEPVFPPKKRLKIGTLKVVSNGIRLGERFLKIVFDNAVANKVEEIYVTIFDKRDDQRRLICLLEEWGFSLHGKKRSADGLELVYKRDFSPASNKDNPKLTYPYISSNAKVFLTPIYPEYHTELFPDSILRTESPSEFIENEPHRNAISKVYISRSLEKNLHSGDIVIFYRTGGYRKGVITTIGIIDNVILDLKNEDEFIQKCRKRSIFTDSELKKHWTYNKYLKPFIVNFLYVYSFPKKINLEHLIKLKIIKDIGSVPRGFQEISKEQFIAVLRETKSDESIIVN